MSIRSKKWVQLEDGTIFQVEEEYKARFAGNIWLPVMKAIYDITPEKDRCVLLVQKSPKKVRKTHCFPNEK